MDKVVGSAAEAVADVGDGARLAVGGFGGTRLPTLFPFCPSAAAGGQLREQAVVSAGGRNTGLFRGVRE